MKKIYIILAVLMTAVLASCVKEQSFSDMTPIPENAIAFMLQNASTRSAASVAKPEKGITIPIEKTDCGEAFYLEETIEELNPTPATRGIPAYTVNVGKIYTTMGVYADAGSGNFQGEATFDRMDKAMYDRKDASEGQGWRFFHSYDGADPWPDETTDVDFYLIMPASPAGVTFTERAGKKIKFSYNTSEIATASAQKDLLFSQTTLTKEQHKGYLPNGAPVTMYHALTGIKFRTGHENTSETKTIITKVELVGLKDKGDCVIDLSATNPVQWSNLSTSIGSFSQEYENATYDPTLTDLTQNPDGTVGYTDAYDSDHKWDSDLIGTTWTSDSTSAVKNLNNKDGSLTFWIIPQKITADVQLKVTFRVKTKDTEEGKEITHTIRDFGSKLLAKNVEWKAGQLRTYTLMPRDIDVLIVDEMDGMTKSDLHVTNTGNVDEYVRIMVIGNWFDKDGNILVGYKTNGDPDAYTAEENAEMVTPWYREDPVYSTGFDSTFPGGRPLSTSNWKRGTGSYFYYTLPIGPGEKIGDTASATEALFQEYKLEESMVPDIYIPVTNSNIRVKAEGVHLVMEVVIQAIGTTKPDGSLYESCWAAWSAATGKEIKQK